MNIKIIALGRIKEKFLQNGIEEFLKRISAYASISVKEINPIEIKDPHLIERTLHAEGEKILSNIKTSDYVVTMEITGKEFSSESFAKKINEIMISGTGEIVFVIGSSHGIGKNVSERANLKMSLSKMTFLHEFARLILLEQIYRAFKILNNETYHK